MSFPTTMKSTLQNRLFRGSKGIGLVESLIAVMVLSIATTAFVWGLSTTYLILRDAETRVTAGIVARSQIEDTLSGAYLVAPATYPSITELPTGYTVASTSQLIPNRDENIQEVTVTVAHQGVEVATMKVLKLSQ